MTSHSQAGQDLFAFESSGRKLNGTFLDIGCNDAVFHSNTYGLEQLGWRGLLVDIAGFQGDRPSPFVQADARFSQPAILDFLKANGWFIDYLSLDVDESQLAAFEALPWPNCKFGVITSEHDSYLRGPMVRDEIRARLSLLNYRLARADVIAPGYGVFEDWFILNGYP